MKALRVALVLAAALVPCAAGAEPTPAPVMINCNEVTTTPGGTASVEVSLQREGEALVAGTQNDLHYPSSFSISADSDCTINPDIGPDSSVKKQLFASNPPEEENTARVIIVALDNENIIPSGLLYTCNLHVESSTPEGRYEIENVNIIASSPTGDRLPVTGTNCVVNVATPTPTGCTSNDDCPPGEVCVEGNCVTPTPTATPIGFCNDDNDCPPGQVCVDHHCVTPTPSVTPTPIGFCNDNNDCPPGQVCVDHHCVTPTPTPQCRENTDCPSGQVCVDGTCVTATPTATPPPPSPTATRKRGGGGGGCNCEIDPGAPTSKASDVLAVLLPAMVLLLRWRSRRAAR